MNILITGGLGYIGFEMLVKALDFASNTNVVSLGRSKPLAELSMPSRAVHEVGSVLDGALLQRLINDYEISHVIHAAGARTSDCAANPALAIESNVFGTQAVVNAARASQSVKAVLLCSIGAVYGKVEQTIDETHPVAPAMNYAVSKAAAEMLMPVRTGNSSFRSIIIRPGFVMGPSASGQGQGSRLNGYVHQTLSGSPPSEIHFLERFFVHAVDELAEKSIRLLFNTEAQGIYHLPGSCCSVGQFVETLSRSGGTTAIAARIDNTAPLPSDLNFDRHDSLMGESSVADIDSIIRRYLV